MLGYDLQCFSNKSIPHSTDGGQGIALEPVRTKFTYVPTVFSMKKVASLFLEYADDQEYKDLNPKDFIKWQVSSGKVQASGTARCNNFPLKIPEFDLYNRSQDQINTFARGGRQALELLMHERTPNADERDCVCLIDTLLVGVLKKEGLDNKSIEKQLVEGGYAGNVGGARNLMQVANSVGVYFGLYDSGKMPTPYFDEFYDSEWKTIITDNN